MSIVTTPFIQNIKDDIKNFIINKANIKRVYIIGCSRSGTTMLHYAMIAFKNTILFDKETNIWSRPSISEVIDIYKEKCYQKYSTFYVSKRHAEWWQDKELYKSIEYISRYRVYVINIIRDPRDVLSSRHPYDKKRYYVEPWMWEMSIKASDFLMKKLEYYKYKLTIKYEDVVLNPKVIEETLIKNLGLELRDNINSWHNLKDNLEKSGLDHKMIPYMHKLRNFDRGSIGKWKNNEESKKYLDNLLKKSEHGKKITLFMENYKYI
jgi:hypothetical protein